MGVVQLCGDEKFAEKIENNNNKHHDHVKFCRPLGLSLTMKWCEFCDRSINLGDYLQKPTIIISSFGQHHASNKWSITRFADALDDWLLYVRNATRRYPDVAHMWYSGAPIPVVNPKPTIGRSQS